mgnify:CR=1 FL=1
MKVWSILFIIFLIVMMPIIPTLSNNLKEITTSSRDNKEYYALITGCTEYENTLNNIPLPVSSMKVIYNQLIQAPNWKEKNIIILFNEEATKESILTAFNQLSKKIDENDVFYFSWNGHGTIITDTNGDESNGYDECICPYDSDYNGSSFISDDELESLFSKIKAEAQFLLFECCQSGGMVENHNHSKKSVLDVEDEGRVVVMLTPMGKNGLFSFQGMTMSILFSEAFSGFIPKYFFSRHDMSA